MGGDQLLLRAWRIVATLAGAKVVKAVVGGKKIEHAIDAKVVSGIHVDDGVALKQGFQSGNAGFASGDAFAFDVLG
jgi:hypothetical protein